MTHIFLQRECRLSDAIGQHIFDGGKLTLMMRLEEKELWIVGIVKEGGRVDGFC